MELKHVGSQPSPKHWWWGSGKAAEDDGLVAPLRGPERPAMGRLLRALMSVLPFLLGGSAAAQIRNERVVRLAELEIDPTRLDRYKALLAEEISTSVRSEPGVLALNAVALKTAPNQIRILEIYADQSAYAAHLRSRHFLKYKHATAGMVTRLTLLETTPVLLCAKPGANCIGH
jgi:quinol monooxygenase YgiN